jgi:putative DNA primase/helicase
VGDEDFNSLSEIPGETPDLQADLLAAFDKATCPAAKLAEIKIPPRAPIIGNWLMEGDLGFIFGARGLGKTWLAMLLARRIAEGVTIGDWTVHKPRKVLYVDGEMPFDGIRERDTVLSSATGADISYLQHEALFHATGRVLNLTNPLAQAALLEKCLREKIEVLILDNLSCLFSGIAENDADAWEQVLPWLLDLRRNRIAVVFIAHAGRNGSTMRGTSRREDAAFWIIQLAAAQDVSEVQTGARFVTRFLKNRNATETECPALEWLFERRGNEARAHVSWKKLSTPDIFRQCLEDGLTTATDISEEMGISKGQVSKMAMKAIQAGWLTKDGREYKLTGQA